MPYVQALGKTIECVLGANLRKVLLQGDIDLYNNGAKVINCRGIGSCSTCAVEIEGEVSEPNWRDTTWRSLPTHSLTKSLRKASQAQVMGNVKVTKYDGFWGQGSQTL
jgi:ferredoxin